MGEQPTDPELLRQLDDARASGGTVEAVLRLECPPGERPVPDTVRDQADRAIRRATEASGETPVDVHVMANMSTAYVAGTERFLRELMAQPEVASAVANEGRADL
ncbi:hypothetical protein CIW49_20930 [Mycolicibacterium sp. P1-18]|uniref:hypothetical protein n=1 Tax=Mycolicibacterium sp. P1-18 TaxID=2024615 RepID=UPI0011F33F10|nr:hypothetical protein [Mycolicibacterium sp. P1-18]KAA0096009.1 hypothetical protein CIW49_20930 [Mycolicibacterium sp. P1-18]